VKPEPNTRTEGDAVAFEFEPTPAAARERLVAVRKTEYVRSRNHLGGAVTGLSPYLTHGFLHVPQVMQALGLDAAHKLAFELGWREFFHHAWRHDGERIFSSLHDGLRAEAAHSRELPADLREGRTGVPVIDLAVRQLYTTGWLHNHARMWLAAFTVHLRAVHWRAGADWMFGHLLDGDLASNHLSWQWVAGTGSHKPYLFNADNVAKYAPAPWHSPGTAVDRSYAALEDQARRGGDVGPEPGEHEGEHEPQLRPQPAARFGFGAPDPQAVAGREVWLLHPWALADPPADLAPDAVCVAVLDAAFHRRWPWSDRRWAFVADRLAALTPHRWWADASTLREVLGTARAVRGVGNQHLGALGNALQLPPMPRAFDDPPHRCRSFSAFWARQPAAQGRLF
jgi:deoxyribodipyrimidine photo-lyase